MKPWSLYQLPSWPNGNGYPCLRPTSPNGKSGSFVHSARNFCLFLKLRAGHYSLHEYKEGNEQKSLPKRVPRFTILAINEKIVFAVPPALLIIGTLYINCSEIPTFKRQFSITIPVESSASLFMFIRCERLSQASAIPYKRRIKFHPLTRTENLYIFHPIFGWTLPMNRRDIPDENESKDDPVWISFNYTRNESRF